jgi:hypothetical protein
MPKTITEKSTQNPQVITFERKFRGSGKRTLTETFTVGMGATSGYGSDCYPHTVWGWRTTKGGEVFIYVTDDLYQFVRAADWTESNQKGEYVYTSQEPSISHPAVEVKLTRRGCPYAVGFRKYYRDPSF